MVCFKPSWSQKITSGLKETFIKRCIVERTNKAEIRPKEQSEKAKSCRENIWNEIQLRGPQRRKQADTRTEWKGVRWSHIYCIVYFFTLNKIFFKPTAYHFATKPGHKPECFMEKLDCFNFKVKVTAKIQNVSECLSRYFLKCWTFYYQTWYCDASLWARFFQKDWFAVFKVKVKVIVMDNIIKICLFNILPELLILFQLNLVCCLKVQGHSEGSFDQIWLFTPYLPKCWSFCNQI